MMLVVDLCRRDMRLSRYEFVDPIVDALIKAGAETQVTHYTQVTSPGCYEGIVLCGTALKDGDYLGNLSSFSWLMSSTPPVLGICAGMQVIAALNGARVLPRPEIGIRDIGICAESPLLGQPRTIQGYHLHTYAPSVPQGFTVLAGSANYAEAICSDSSVQYGILFHPEVRNTWILASFARLCGSI
jgi:GMP synthase (glutamine-hydrolysing)